MPTTVSHHTPIRRSTLGLIAAAVVIGIAAGPAARAKAHDTDAKLTSLCADIAAQCHEIEALLKTERFGAAT
jgi:hypothetical protein